MLPLRGDRCGGRSTRSKPRRCRSARRQRGGMRLDIQNLACHSGNEAQRKSNTFTFLSISSLLTLSVPLPALAPARSSFTPRERDHKRTSGPPRARLGENLTAEYSEVLSATALCCVCIKISQESIFASILLKRATASLGLKGRQSRSPRRESGGFAVGSRGDWQHGERRGSQLPTVT